MNEENQEKYINVEFNYISLPSKGEVTKAVFNYLAKHNVEVYKAESPVGIWNYETFHIKSRQIKSSDIQELASQCYEEFKNKTILLLEVLTEYNLVDDFHFIIRYTEV